MKDKRKQLQKEWFLDFLKKYEVGLWIGCIISCASAFEWALQSKNIESLLIRLLTASALGIIFYALTILKYFVIKRKHDDNKREEIPDAKQKYDAIHGIISASVSIFLMFANFHISIFIVSAILAGALSMYIIWIILENWMLFLWVISHISIVVIYFVFEGFEFLYWVLLITFIIPYVGIIVWNLTKKKEPGRGRVRRFVS